MGVSRPAPLILILVALAGGVVFLVRTMHRMRARAQFLVLLVLGVTIGFTFLAMVQLPRFPPWLGVSLMVAVLAASPFAIRTFVRSLIQEDEEEEESRGGTK